MLPPAFRGRFVMILGVFPKFPDLVHGFRGFT
jgi:hypothetical protein